MSDAEGRQIGRGPISTGFDSQQTLMRDIESAREFLNNVGVFFDVEDDDEPRLKQTLNMNDTWAWACADGEYVPDEKLPEVAALFWRYGWAGILYWVSKQNNWCRSEFYDNNRFIDFVKHEEDLIREIPDLDKRAYKKISYTIGE